MPELAPDSRYGSFQIVGRLGRGLTGPVYRAIALKDPNHTEVALKLLESRDESVRSYFKNEMALLRRAREHGRPQPHLVEYVASITTQEPFALATRFYAGGKELTEHIDAGMSPAHALRVVEHVAEALDYLHYGHPDAPVVHRDVKPANILVDEQGNALLIDLSAATHQNFRLENERGLGTPQYMPPEQYEGHEQPQTDQFALAMVAFQMLSTRTLLGQKADPESRQMAALRDSGYAKVREQLRAYPATADVITRAIAYQWQTRYASCLEFAYDLRRALAQDGAPLAVESAASPRPTLTWAHIGMAAAAAVALVLLVAFAGGRGSAAAPSRPMPATITLAPPPGRPDTGFYASQSQVSDLAPTSDLLPATAVQQASPSGSVRPADGGCALRNIPSTRGQVVRFSSTSSLVPSSVGLQVLSQDGDWYFVRLPDGREGWCPDYQLSGVAGGAPSSRADAQPATAPPPAPAAPAPTEIPPPPAPTELPPPPAPTDAPAPTWEPTSTPALMSEPPPPTVTAQSDDEDDDGDDGGGKDVPGVDNEREP